MDERTPLKDIKVAYECVRQMLTLDTEVVVNELDLMTEVNEAAITRFRDLASYSDDLHAGSAVVWDGLAQLDELERKVDALHVTVQELDEWSRELAVKLQRVPL